MKLLRIHARVSVDAPASVRFQEGALGYTVANLSVGGALLQGGPEISVGTDVQVELFISDADPIHVNARVMRHQRLSPGKVALGLRFIDIDPEVEDRLTDAVTDAYKSIGARILGQVRGELQRRGVTDVAKVAAELQSIKDEQAQAHLFASDLYTSSGSDAVASIVSGTTGEERECIVWSLNLYLGLNREPRVIQRTREAVDRFGTGSGTSAPSGGLSKLHFEIERRVAEMVGKERAIIFSTGYAANLGALSALPGPNDLVLMDREAHASMHDGVKLSGRKYMVFNHNDVKDLERKLRRFGPRHENVFVVVESAYSMSGDLAPLREIAELKKRYPFFFYVDEAHTFGFYGEQGRGYCHQVGVTDQVDFIMSTFSKATASVGGFVAADEKFCTLIQATSSPYIFQACLSPPDAATILAALDEIRDHPEHAAALHEKNRLMRHLLTEVGFDLGESKSPVIPVFVSDLEKLYRLCAFLYLDGIFSVPITYPAVGVNDGRIRFIVNAHHTVAQIERTVEVLARYARELDILH